jgi:hypothetical protein
VIDKQGTIELVGTECSKDAKISLSKDGKVLETLKLAKEGKSWHEVIPQGIWQSKMVDLIKKSTFDFIQPKYDIGSTIYVNGQATFVKRVDRDRNCYVVDLNGKEEYVDISTIDAQNPYDNMTAAELIGVRDAGH